MVSYSGAFSYKYNTAEGGGCSSVFFLSRYLNLEKYQKEDPQRLE